MKRVRMLQGLTQAELSTRLSEMGRPVPVASVGKIEAGDRRVEVDDLIALAVALEVSPITLLMPYTRGPHDAVSITGHDAAAQDVWYWTAGAMPLDPESDWEDAEAQWNRFTTASLPWWYLVRPEERNSAHSRFWGERFYDEDQARMRAEEGGDGEHPEAP